MTSNNLGPKPAPILNEISVKNGKEKKMSISRSIKGIEDSKLLLQDNLRENLVTDLQNESISNFK